MSVRKARSSGHLTPLAEASGSDIPGLEEAAFYVDTFRLNHARTSSRRAIEYLDALDHDDHPLVSVADTPIREALAWATECSVPLDRRQFAMGRRAPETGNHIMAAVLLFEALRSLAMDEMPPPLRRGIDRRMGHQRRDAALDWLRDELDDADRRECTELTYAHLSPTLPAHFRISGRRIGEPLVERGG